MKKMAWFFLLILLVALCGSAMAQSTDMGGFALWGTPKKGENSVRLYLLPEAGSDVVGRLEAGQACPVVGARGRFYQLQWADGVAYASQKLINITGQLPEDPAAVPFDCLGEPGTLERYIFAKKETNHLPLSGTVMLDAEASGLALYVFDTRQMKMEKCIVASLPQPENTLELAKCRRLFSLDALKAGWKELYITALCEEGQRLICRTVLYVKGKGNTPAVLNEKCRMTAQEALSDGSTETQWRPRQSGDSIKIVLPSEAALMTLTWKSPAAFRMSQWDEAGVLLAEDTFDTGFYADAAPILPQTRTLHVTPITQNVAICDLLLYAPDYPQHAVQQWQPLSDNVDILFFSTHQDDEMLFFGGGVPYYAASTHETGVVYMANCSRLRYQEALNGLWTAGLRTHPVFLGYRDKLVNSVDTARQVWNGEESLQAVVAVLRKYRPRVVVTHDFEGEYGHSQHKLTADMLAKAVVLAADPDYAPDSAEQYGVWQVNKLYIHLYPENSITMDWSRPLYDDSPITPILLATAAYSCHASQQGAFTMEWDGVIYDNRKFGLYFSTVGLDEMGNDFMEHIKN